MKPLLILLVFICFGLIASAQNSADLNKYKISLPSYWKGSSGLFQNLDTILAKYWSVLKGKRICTSQCKPEYFVSLDFTEPKFGDKYITSYSSSSINEKYTVVMPFNFLARLILKNQKGEIVSQIPLIDSVEVQKLTWAVTNNISNQVSGLQTPEVDQPYTGTDLNQRLEARDNRLRQEQEQISRYRRNIGNSSVETTTEKKLKKEDYINQLYLIIDQRLKALR